MELLHIFVGFLEFCAAYGMLKCSKTMICGSVLLLFILSLHSGKKQRSVRLAYYSIFFLYPMLFMGMSKLFFVRPFVKITIWLNNHVKPVYGGLYFSVAVILLFIFCGKHMVLRRKIRRLPELFEEGLKQQAIDFVAGEEKLKLRRKYLQRVRIYVTESSESPFSGGIVRPYIVVPEKILIEWQREKCLTVLCHELIHIRSGHIVALTLFGLLKIYWWINPLMYVCENMLREDMELLCDEACFRAVGVSRMEYGTILLEMIALLSGVRKSQTAAFLEKNNFLILKRRIAYLGQAAKGERKKKKRGICYFLAAMAALLVVINVTSYPRYTRLTEISLYDEKLNLIIYDSPKMQAAVEVKDGKLILNEDKFAGILEEEQVCGEYVYISYDTIMKVPGVGGCGNVGMVATGDLSDIFYLNAYTWENRLLEFFLKYLI